ncbi:MAG: ABC transporter ATP-binding protein [Chitinophagales bacterium]|nr:ABC transporter ATP-binding protein [Chitinophagales bacterium]MCO5280495.1 ABC transporter ATP-binding protein [Chitinophagales bacterium]OJV26799.1 MAG: ABC transporter ATP-binding protein [Bacteroidetes bacterium 37-13]HRP40108.1 ABC transporter ATP-binding protein [Chitinophagales bacterium]
MNLEQPTAIEVKNLSFGYEADAELFFKQFSLSISKGERFGLLGPNGAGKTTLMNLLTGVLLPKQGNILISGESIVQQPILAKMKFGLVPQAHSLYPELTAMENLNFFGAWSGVKQRDIETRAKHFLEKMGLWESRNKLVLKFSGGMKSRLNLAVGVIHEPEILFLDEPTSAVDVQSRHAILSFLRTLNNAGTTLVYTSHLLSEAEQLCTRIALIDEAKIIAEGTVQELLKASGKENLETLFLSLTGRNFRDS